LHYPEILSIEPAPETCAYQADDTILYALGLGAGDTAEDLGFVYEKGLRALPTFAVLMARSSGAFITDGGIDLAMIVHGEQRLTIHEPLPPEGRLTSQSRCLSVVDKGKEKGALLNIESTISDAQSGTRHATTVMTLFCRGDGGFDGPTSGQLPLHPIPERSHDLEVVLPTMPQQAALYRLTGDKNPLHIDPQFAQAVGFERPILHGLCTYGIACRAIMKACCGNDPAMIEQFDARFAAPVFPGDAITTRIWRDGRRLQFECLVGERGSVVIRNGFCTLRQ